MQFDDKECVRCVMGTRWDKSIEFDDSGVCNHCLRYADLVDSRVFSGDEGAQKLDELNLGKEKNTIVLWVSVEV
jgi:hypothetical protein